MKSIYLFAEVIFYSEQRKHFPTNGYRSDAIFNKSNDYWGITFIDLPIEKFNAPTLTIIKFSFQDCHYQEVMAGQSFLIMEVPHQVGEGQIISIEKNETYDHKHVS